MGLDSLTCSRRLLPLARVPGHGKLRWLAPACKIFCYLSQNAEFKANSLGVLQNFLAPSLLRSSKLFVVGGRESRSVHPMELLGKQLIPVWLPSERPCSKYFVRFGV